jgi:hypothetical protein
MMPGKPKENIISRELGACPAILQKFISQTLRASCAALAWDFGTGKMAKGPSDVAARRLEAWTLLATHAGSTFGNARWFMYG